MIGSRTHPCIPLEKHYSWKRPKNPFRVSFRPFLTIFDHLPTLTFRNFKVDKVAIFLIGSRTHPCISPEKHSLWKRPKNPFRVSFRPFLTIFDHLPTLTFSNLKVDKVVIFLIGSRTHPCIQTADTLRGKDQKILTE